MITSGDPSKCGGEHPQGLKLHKLPRSDRLRSPPSELFLATCDIEVCEENGARHHINDALLPLGLAMEAGRVPSFAVDVGRHKSD